MDFIQIAEKEFIPYRSKTAAFQRFVLEAAEQGDEEAVHIYEDASRELTLLASGVKRQLNYASDPVKVSLTGGVLHAEKYIVPYLTDELQKKGMKYISRKNDPLTGSVLLALKHRKMDEVWIVVVLFGHIFVNRTEKIECEKKCGRSRSAKRLRKDFAYSSLNNAMRSNISRRDIVDTALQFSGLSRRKSIRIAHRKSH